MEDFNPSDYKEYENFNDFFTRRLNNNSRPISHINNSKIAVSAADCRLTVFDNIEESKKLWIKGKNFTLGKLIQDENIANEFIGGSIASFRLSPQDYHHYHSPIDGVVEYWKSIPDMNARSIVVIRNPIWGKILYIPIGAELVGSVQLTDKVKNRGEIKKGEEIETDILVGETIGRLYQ
ncbi:hypothetical protein G6F47_012898 [Rhizopus delemar]|nr:hypothetical protein G6F47_012898 [Rhizopus delemar]KAG1623434.1 hypothetical protein G6F44_012867 [Rhizopus delemar]